ncbi:radical SAM protein [Maridesulfovibrio ferrireducens]|uniref:B12-binding domain-containing radical SAM protein n=1 Tax=Maridesulfovibrio ferrireducens TaxID=246191 RepID=UPI001A302CCC|nr:radical SAM protein [Maridesulfovibrio ferrireducens]MBI9113163.1 B12-binding domain-containing radical SAM protein [Maridesulfovibrio ferrireducens]
MGNVKKKIVFGIFSQNKSMAASMLGALAEKLGWDVDVVFLPLESRPQDVLDTLDYIPDIFALSFASYNREQAFFVAKVLKERGIKVIGGGIHATAMPGDLVQTGYFDAVMHGDGMGILDEVLQNYQDLTESVVIHGKKHHNKRVYLDYFFSESQKKILRETQKTDLLTSYGCPFKCTFCASSRKGFMTFPDDQLIEFMVDINDKYGVKVFTFQDDLLFNDVKRVKRISKHLRELPPEKEISFGKSANCRASSFSGALATEIKNLNITDVSFGIESASNKLLKFLNKKQTEEDCYNAIDVCKRHDLYSRINLMFGIPTQDEEDYKTTLEFVKKAKPDIVNMFYYTPYPGTDLYDYCFDHGYIPAEYNRDRFDWFNAQNDGIREVHLKLNGVDYQMADKYMQEISDMYDPLNFLKPLVEEIDKHTWVIFGSSTQIYFSQVLNVLKKIDMKNCLGYYDIDPEAEYCVERRVEFSKFIENDSVVPDCIVTYTHLSSEDYRNFQEIISRKFGNIPLISISTMQRHSLEDVKKMLNPSQI